MDNPPSTPPAPDSDFERRAILIAAGTLGGAGLLAAAVPFVAGLEPSARALNEGGPVEFDLAGLTPGEMSTVA